MLPLALVLAPKCDNGKYWCESKTNCVTARECADDGLVAYKIFMTCNRKFEPDEVSGFVADADGVSACPTDKYTVIGTKTIWCVNSASDCKECYIARNHPAFAADPY